MTVEFLKFTVRKPVDFAIASVACVVRVERGVCRDVRLALGGVAPGPIRAAAEEGLVGRPLDAASVAWAADAALAGARPLSGNAYKIDVAKALVRRALLPEPSDREKTVAFSVPEPTPGGRCCGT